jgi:hypothetical protein
VIQNFAVEAGTFLYQVLDAFLPVPLPNSWSTKDGKATFFPFLVVTYLIRRLDRNDDERTEDERLEFWLPYWHTVDGERKTTRYGQWAPTMAKREFASLLAQARVKGHIA